MQYLEKVRFQKSPSKDDTVINLTPAFRWAQSLETIYLEVKFATRLDSPACIDLLDQTVELSPINESNYTDGQTLHISATCRNDARFLSYNLTINLHQSIMPLNYQLTDKKLKKYEALKTRYESLKKEYPKNWKTYLEQVAVIQAEEKLKEGNKNLNTQEQDEDFEHLDVNVKDKKSDYN